MAVVDKVKGGDKLISSIPRVILLSLIIGANILLLLGAAENQGIASDLTRALLWPGLGLAQATGHVANDIGVVIVIIVDSVVYGFVSFLVLCVLRTILYS